MSEYTSSASFEPQNSIVRSAVFKGVVWHQRYLPTDHKFHYRVFMMYLDLAEQDAVLGKSLFWGTRWYHAARFKRADYFSIAGDLSQAIDSAVRQEVKRQIGAEVNGPVCVLTNFRYFGYNTNPISCYYCYDSDAEKLVALLIEVTNTPWGERHHYVLDLRSYSEGETIDFQKKMHVSPFMPMDRVYRWRGSKPSQVLRYSLASVLRGNGDTGSGGLDDQVQFDSGVVFKRTPITGHALNSVLIFYPFMTVKVIAAIYWQALKLWMKRVPFVPHPSKSTASIKVQS